MQLTEHTPGGHYSIRDINDKGIRIGETRHSTSILIGAHFLETGWPVESLEDLDDERIEPIVKLQPEVVLVGFGRTQPFPSPAIQYAFLKHGIGVEIMTLDAACRTFNVLMSEDRRALAALIWS